MVETSNSFDSDQSDDNSIVSTGSDDNPEIWEDNFEDDGLVFRWISEDHEAELNDDSHDEQLKCPPSLKAWKEVDLSVSPLVIVKASSDDDLLRLLIHDKDNPKRKKNESIQLLHGAYVAGASRGLLLIGSRTKLMYGVDVNFEDDLMEAYDTVVGYMYDKYFSMFYELSIDTLQSEHRDEICNTLRYLDWIDEHPFWTSFMIW